MSCWKEHRQRAFSTVTHEVTCTGCRDGCKRSQRSPWLAYRNEVFKGGKIRVYDHRPNKPHNRHEWVCDRELRARAWYFCCRHAGHPAPHGVDGTATIARIGAALAIKRLRQDTAMLRVAWQTSEDTRAAIAKLVKTTPPDVLTLIRPAISDFTKIAKQLVAVDELRSSADRVIAGACAKINERTAA